MVKHMRGTINKREILGTLVCASDEMSSLEDIFSTNQCPTAVFTSKGTDVTPNSDRGVCKIVKQHGVEGEMPMIGDKVCVHYTGKLLNGKTFDSSFDRKEPFVFNVGKGQVIKAWDIGICSMQKGEVCLLLCKPEYAYGSSGSPPKVPPNATLVFEIELLSFRGEELTEDGGIIRRIKVKGEGYNNPNEGATVNVHLKGWCGGRLFESRDITFVVGESEDEGVPLGVDRAMEKMQKGECCLLYLKPKYGYGKEGKTEYDIESNAELLYEVTLKDFEKAKESWEMDLKEKLERAVLVKQKGTQYFKAGRYNHAVIQYQRIVTWLEMECGAGKEQLQAIQALLLVAHLNLALCYLRLREYSQTVENCDKVMELDPENEKALYRRGEARLLRNEFSLALGDFRQVLQVNSFNRAARSQIVVCQRKIREHHERDKKIYANMFQRFAEHDAKVVKLKRKKEDSGLSDQNKGLKRPRLSQDCS
ncbi:peptidyl-prolyl cis-trans isomerase FKBP5-like isoform X1 [Myxocyprinus asiaticus]|uniref:peptidyl-prolyl cis-trans isomerase FKBP5-like isoform X1 n=1 Tax=Myxocyprinus asiaticus TaxID=70543 RepID=UPI0022213ECF|nr:peptidyl-prolyl cis-trans isomerase FKBP5-like isoform X1 [Myxocyprinus asiaticus]